MNLKSNLLTLGLMFLCASFFAQDVISVSGVVLNKKNNQPLYGALVRFDQTSYGSNTNADGGFNFSAPSGKYTLVVNLLSYNEIRKEINLNGPISLKIELEENTEDLNLVVVSAGRYEQNIGEVTVSMEVIQPKLLEDKNVVNIDEILQQTPGVAIVDDEPQIRSGSGYSFGAGSRVQVLVDNIPILSGDAGKPSWGFLPTENVSQIEIIKGASSVLYGSSALSGVINFRTAYPTAIPKTKLTVYHGMYSKPQSEEGFYWERQGMKSGINFSHSQKFGKLDFVFASSMQYDDGHLGPIIDSLGQFENSSYNPKNVNRYSAGNRARFNLQLRYRATERLYLGVSSIYSAGNSLATLLWNNSTTGLYSAYEGSATRTIQQLYTVDPFIEYQGKRGATHTLRTRWQSLDNNNDNNQGNFSDVLYGEYQVQKNWDLDRIKNFTTTAGLVGIQTDARGELFVGGNADGHNTAKNYAAYVQLDKKLWDKLNLSGGLRYEQFQINEEKQGKPVFRAGANYKVSKATYVRASLGQGYRFPSIAEKFIVTGLGAINIFANPDLKPETSNNVEIGVKQGFKIGEFKGFADFAVFQQKFENFIEFTFGQWTPVPFTNLEELNNAIGFKSLNTGEAMVRGAEFSLLGTGKIGETQIDILGGYTYTKPVSTTPDYVYAVTQQQPGTLVISEFAQASYLSTSENSSNNILKYRLEHLVRLDCGLTRKNLTAGISFRYNSHMQNIDNAFGKLEDQFPAIFNPGINQWRAEHTTGDYVFDLRLGYKFSDKQRIAIMVNNVLNREYAIRPLSIEEPRMTMIQYTLSL
ncbi:MAG: TonB-dependent receptor [Bacteroidetes bacterium]|nr:TonB-dependent receptor [Bacteroidota bacterium]